MSLMGYVSEDIEEMMEMVHHASNYAYDAKDMPVVEGCNKALEFFEGLLIEGRV